MLQHAPQRGMTTLKKELRIHLDYYGIGREMNDREVQRRARIEIDSIEREIMRLRYGIPGND